MGKRKILLSFLMVAIAGFGLVISLGAAGQEKVQGADAALRALLTSQAADWNRGDIDGFMRGYWKSEQTTFSGTSGVSRGWQTVLEHYHKN